MTNDPFIQESIAWLMIHSYRRVRTEANNSSSPGKNPTHHMPILLNHNTTPPRKPVNRYTHTDTHTHTGIRTRTQGYAHRHTQTHTHTGIRTHTHTHTDTQTHTGQLKQSLAKKWKNKIKCTSILCLYFNPEQTQPRQHKNNVHLFAKCFIFILIFYPVSETDSHWT